MPAYFARRSQLLTLIANCYRRTVAGLCPFSGDQFYMRKLAVIVTLALGAMALPAQAASFSDGSFEAEGAAANYGSTSYCYFSDGGAPALCGNEGTPWSGSGLIQSGSGPWGGTSAFDGAYYSFVQSGQTLSQTFTADKTSNYLLNWVDAERNGYGSANDYVVTLGDATSGTILANSTSWTGRSLDAHLVAGQTYTLTFQGLDSRGGDNTAFIDGVSLRAVPEPASWALMIGGVGLAGTALRRARRTGRRAFA